jgi:hypothetical protein
LIAKRPVFSALLGAVQNKQIDARVLRERHGQMYLVALREQPPSTVKTRRPEFSVW